MTSKQGAVPSSVRALIEWSRMTTRILVVEDDPDIAHLVVRYLNKAGFGTKHVAGGREALQAIMNERPDLLILDLMLPQVDGLEICRAVRARKPRRQRSRSSC